MIALEPEAASLHCRHLPDTDFVGYKDNSIKKPTFEPGTKYLVVDAGGTEPFLPAVSSCLSRVITSTTTTAINKTA